MRLNFILTGFISALILSALILSAGSQLPDLVSSSEQPVESLDWILNNERFIKRIQVLRTIKEAKSQPVKPCGKPRAGIVNHHDLAPELIAEFFVTLSQCRPEIKTFVILSPDHFGQVPGAWLGPNNIGSALEREHGIGVLTPFISEIFPSASVDPFIINQRASSRDFKFVLKYIEEAELKSEAFVLVSADMSHYLDEQTALQKDAQSLRALDIGDELFFFEAKDDFTDSGKSIGLVIQALEPTTWQTLNHQISTTFGGSLGYTTSYITGFWE